MKSNESSLTKAQETKDNIPEASISWDDLLILWCNQLAQYNDTQHNCKNDILSSNCFTENTVSGLWLSVIAGECRGTI